jgi:hypothetical protein
MGDQTDAKFEMSETDNLDEGSQKLLIFTIRICYML